MESESGNCVTPALVLKVKKCVYTKFKILHAVYNILERDMEQFYLEYSADVAL